jgi:arylformamidase
MSSRFFDLSHAVENGVVTYPGLPAPVICDFLSREQSAAHYAPGTEFQIGRIDMVGNTGTYVDAPFHRFCDGKDLAELDLASIADLPLIVVDARGERAIGRERFETLDVEGCAVLVWTNWSRHYATPHYVDGHPYLERAAAELLVDRGARLVGIDSVNIDDIRDRSRPVHTVLLGAGVVIAEHLTNLDVLPATRLRFSAVPARVRAFGTFPVRAYALVER